MHTMVYTPRFVCVCHPCAGAMLIFSVSVQFERMIPEGNPCSTKTFMSAALQPSASFSYDTPIRTEEATLSLPCALMHLDLDFNISVALSSFNDICPSLHVLYTSTGTHHASEYLHCGKHMHLCSDRSMQPRLHVRTHNSSLNLSTCTCHIQVSMPAHISPPAS